MFYLMYLHAMYYNLYWPPYQKVKILIYRYNMTTIHKTIGLIKKHKIVIRQTNHIGSPSILFQPFWVILDYPIKVSYEMLNLMIMYKNRVQLKRDV